MNSRLVISYTGAVGTESSVRAMSQADVDLIESSTSSMNKFLVYFRSLVPKLLLWFGG